MIKPGDLISRNSTGLLCCVLDRKLYKKRWIILTVSEAHFRRPTWDFENLYSLVQGF